MAQFHISKDPFNKTPIAYVPLTEYIVLGSHGLDSKYSSFWHNNLNQPSGL